MYNEAFVQWKAFHDSLVVSVQSYLNACATLESVLTQPLQSTGDKPLLEGVLQLVSSELPSFSACNDQLRTSWCSLTRLRNRATKLVPIHSLPPEVLSNIFVIAKRSARLLCVQDVVPDDEPPKPSCLDHIMGVCAYWRHIAIDTSSLWTHIDLVTAGRWANRFMARAQYRLERAGDLPIELHIQDTSDPSQAGLGLENVQRLVGFLSPYAKRYRSLHILFQYQMQEIFNLVFQFLTQCDVPSVLDTLILATQADNQQMFASYQPILFSGALSNSKYDQLLGPVRHLDLQSIYIDWASAVYHDLVDLSIQYLPQTLWPTTHQLAEVFSVCPRLRRIKLGRFGVTAGNTSHNLAPILLNDLEEINLHSLRGGCETVLSLISPGSKPFSSSIVMTSSPGELEAAHSFFHNSNVRTLFISDRRSSGSFWISYALGILPQLEQLAIDAPRLAVDSNTIVVETWPKLHTLYMIGGRFTAPSIFLILDANHIKTLSLWGCQVWEVHRRDNNEAMEELQVALLDRVSQLECVQERASCPVWAWSCVQTG
ncbi:hypothetical protein FRC09_001777 [Ceratobasidium sp. 395]|nr:hypothetical protein FRC09_001777 [Ceratobasidium sp. 395]